MNKKLFLLKIKAPFFKTLKRREKYVTIAGFWSRKSKTQVLLLLENPETVGSDLVPEKRNL